MPVSTDINPGFSIKLVRDIRLLLIAVWLGAAVFFSFSVAPTAFSVLQSRALAGDMVSRSLGNINTLGVVISLVLLGSGVLFTNAVSRRALYLELVSIGIIGLSTFTGKWIIAARMHQLRLAMEKPIDEVAQSDPLRIAFNSLHGYSVAVLSVAMIAAIVCLLLIARRAGR